MATTKKKKVSSKKAAPKKPARKISAKEASESPRVLLGANNHVSRVRHAIYPGPPEGAAEAAPLEVPWAQAVRP